VQKEIDLFVREVYVVVMYMVPNPPPGARPRRFVQMRGMDDMPLAAEIHGVKLGQGTWVGGAGAARVKGEDFKTAKEIVIGHGVARAFGPDLGKASLELGDVLTLGEHPWVVVGIMDEGSSAFGSEIWTRDLNVQANFGRPDSYNSFVVRTADAEKATLAVQLIKNFKSERNFQAYTEREYYAKMNDTSKQFSVASWVVAIIMAIGGILGIMNTMYAAVSQRSKDIGVLRLMGYRRFQILLSFHFESMLIAVAGGLLGCILAYLLFDGRTVTSIISSGAGGGGKTVVLRLVCDLQVLSIGAIFSLYMGALGGLVPALSAMRLRPLESLK
jgi:ABC-type lipoprotein release transport system permease subunit